MDWTLFHAVNSTVATRDWLEDGTTALADVIVPLYALATVGLYTPTRLLESLLALVPILVALPLGVQAAKKLSAQTFQRVILVLLAASVVSLIHDTFAGAPS